MPGHLRLVPLEHRQEARRAFAIESELVQQKLAEMAEWARQLDEDEAEGWLFSAGEFVKAARARVGGE